MKTVDCSALVGGILRSPFAHARIRRIDTSQAEKIEGVEAIVSASDFPDGSPFSPSGNGRQNDLTCQVHNLIAHEKVFYEGQPILAIAAKDESTLDAAMSAIDIEYAVLPQVLDVQKAMEPDAPLLHESLFTQGIKPEPSQPSNIATRMEAVTGNVSSALTGAEVVVAEEFMTEAVYADGIAQPWCQAEPLAQDRFRLRSRRMMTEGFCSLVAAMLDRPKASICFESAAGGAACQRGGYTDYSGSDLSDQAIFLEPIALMLAIKSQQAVEMTMAREDVFRSSAAVPGHYMTMRLGADKSGKLLAAEVVVCMQAGAFPGGPVREAVDALLACYQLPAYRLITYEVLVNRPMVTHCQAAGSTGVIFALESLLDDLARKLNICPLVLRRMNARSAGRMLAPGAELENQALDLTINAALHHPHYLMNLEKNQGRGVALGATRDVQGKVISCGAHLCDVEIDLETGQVDIMRYTVLEAGAVSRGDEGADLDGRGRKRHVQAGVTMGLGRALNESYVFDENGKLQNTSFRDYRLPLACDFPEITVVNLADQALLSHHGDATKGCGHDQNLSDARSFMLPPLAAVANAIADATSARITSLPMSPPVVLAETQRQKWKRRLRR